MKKQKLLCILHYSPPAHGASKVGDFIKSSERLREEFDCKFIKIKSSNTIGDIGKINFKKIYLVIELFFKILFTIVIFRPDKIYFTASIRGVAFYRDLLLSNIWKVYKLFKSCEVFYHYHTKGVNEFVKNDRNKKLTSYFLKGINLVLLSPMLEKDFDEVKTFKKVYYLPNGVEDSYDKNSFENYISKKDFSKIEVLYLAHMKEDKGLFESLKLVKKYKNNNIHFHFAGSWQNDMDKNRFINIVKEFNLENKITLHGFISGDEKIKLIQKCSFLIYPSKNDAFPLTLLEMFSHGLPVLTTNQGSIPDIVDDKSGVVVSDLNDLGNGFKKILDDFVNIDTANYCRNRYLENFSLDQFEENLIKVLK